MKNDALPFSFPVKVGNISVNAVEVTLKANDRELKALVAAWNVLTVEAVSAELQISRWKKDGVRVRGRIRAKLAQACVVTLEPVDEVIDEPLEVIFVPEGSKLARIVANDSAEMILDPDGPDLPEMFTGDTIDVGQTVAEHVALALDPYPRKAGAHFGERIESTEETDQKPNPFTVLKDWKKD
ncbi:YceD family protein [Pararhizobium sp.]|uniref:YceD family protein n=1 Tax=Pararhizobium sp. TaxID=1977563 RepID=UPI002718BB69|nr:DUF177 domain-containing protein [Pararhizobium sp.]MDO9416000.1 DUF177 domain-containing protein [Pararhizobium sp.]